MNAILAVPSRAKQPARRTPPRLPFTYRFPPGGRAIDRLPAEFVECRHTPETWAAYIQSEAAIEAHAIRAAAEQLAARSRQWVSQFGSRTDPGADAITAAGLALPSWGTTRSGTPLQHAGDELAALARRVEVALVTLAEVTDTSDPRNSPENIARVVQLPEYAVR